MRAVRRRDTAPEKAVADILLAMKIYHIRNPESLPGKPDFFFQELKLIVFVHGCFWHGHSSCSKGTTLPKTNRQFWANKISGNKLRDARVNRWYWRRGFSVVTVWECELRHKMLPSRLYRKLFNNSQVCK